MAQILAIPPAETAAWFLAQGPAVLPGCGPSSALEELQGFFKARRTAASGAGDRAGEEGS